MKSAGAAVHLGHNGLPCRSPSRTDILTIIHINGFHHVKTSFCGCQTDVAESLDTNQLLRAMLFPASWQTPKTAFTFEVLDSLESLSSYGRVSAYDFYYSLQRLTDGQGTENWPVSKSMIGEK